MKITDMNKFTLSIELVPDRNGKDFNVMLDKLQQCKDLNIDFISVTMGAGGSLRGGSLPLSFYSQNLYNIPALSHFTCREKNRFEIENMLCDQHYLGIRNILALRGDPPAGEDKNSFVGEYHYAYKLVEQIEELNNGYYQPFPNSENIDVNGKELRHANNMDFCIVVAGHPEDSEEDEVFHMRVKQKAGAQAIITQMIFDFDTYKNYVEMLRRNNINLPVIAGFRPLTSLKQCESIEKFFNLPIKEEIKAGLQIHGREFGIELANKFVKDVKEFGGAGVHFFTLNDIELVKEILN